MSTTRIASLLAAGTEIVHALRLGENLVAISHECDHPPELMNRPRVTRANVASTAESRSIDHEVKSLLASGKPLYEIDVPLLASMKPDLIVTQSQCAVCAIGTGDVWKAVEADRRLADARVAALSGGRLAEVLTDIERVADAAGASEAGRAVVQSLQYRVRAVRRIGEAIPAVERPRTVCIEWIDPVMVAANWVPEMIEWAGGMGGLTQAGQRSAYTDWNRVVEFDPQVIVVMPCGFDIPRTQREAPSLVGLPGWAGLSAVRSGRVFAVDGNAFFNRSGPRLVDSLEILAGLLHPKQFPLVSSSAYAMLV